MPYFRITLLRSSIGLPRKTTATLHALGLRKRMATKYLPITPSIAGQIMRIKELVDVKEVDEAMTKQQIRDARRPDPGFYVEKRATTGMMV
ncbi:50S ribosomal protein-like protein L30 [Lojkania enalia]|uniref:Large ribosomal subunit protein uL30m n=1 Tax=Lojkania enalia TaxID=147567 RepID=A0A9P4MY01_9PLEO|nr:50S ribosomal protein-like protein L30 [Didymosphaeria enalia]